MNEFKGCTVCSGSWELGTACGECTRCEALRPKQKRGIQEIPDWLLEMSKQINTQPNRCTSDPFWQVRCKRYIITEEGYSDHHWELHKEDGEGDGLPVYSTNPGYDNRGAAESFAEDNPSWSSQWVEDTLDVKENQHALFIECFDFESHKEDGDVWPDGYYVVHLQETDEIVSTHLTQADAEWFIQRKQHDYSSLYTYVESAYWSPQLKQLIGWIKDLT